MHSLEGGVDCGWLWEKDKASSLLERMRRGRAVTGPVTIDQTVAPHVKAYDTGTYRVSNDET